MQILWIYNVSTSEMYDLVTLNGRSDEWCWGRHVIYAVWNKSTRQSRPTEYTINKIEL
jgi:hypothetical protein